MKHSIIVTIATLILVGCNRCKNSDEVEILRKNRLPNGKFIATIFYFITSTSEDKRAMIMRSSSFSCFCFFFDRIQANEAGEQAFGQTKDKMERMRAHESQSPQIDANGNRITNELWTNVP